MPLIQVTGSEILHFTQNHHEPTTLSTSQGTDVCPHYAILSPLVGYYHEGFCGPIC